MIAKLTPDEEITIRTLLNMRIVESWPYRNASAFYRQELCRCVKLLRKIRKP